MKKIMFNDQYGLTQAVLDGRKTMTRRIANPATDKQISFGNVNKEWYEDEKGNSYIPIYEVGEVIAIAMSYEHIFYELHCALPEECSTGAGWNNKMFVKSEYMPYKIKVTNVMVEPLQNISDVDCLKEGIWKGKVGSLETHYMDAYYPYKSSLEPCCTPRDAFELLIDKVSGKGTWNSNPITWVYEFELTN